MPEQAIIKSNQPEIASFAPAYDVVIVNYQSTDLLLDILADFENSVLPPTKIFIVDNDSNDAPGRATQFFPEIYLLNNRKNLGFARAANQGWKLGESPIVLFINPDARLLQKDYSPILGYLATHTQIGAAGPCIFDSDGSVQGSARGFHNFWTLLAGRKGPLTRLFPNSKMVQRDLPILSWNGVTPTEVDWVSGACIFVKRRALEQVDGFDQRYFMYFEDTDLCRRIKKHGWSTCYVPSSRILHRVGQSSKNKPLQTLWWFHQSWYRYMCRHHFASNPLAQMVSAPIVGLCFILRTGTRLLYKLMATR